MEIAKPAWAGSLESNDCLVNLHPLADGSVQVVVESIVEAQFGERIEAVAREVLAAMKIAGARLHIQDKGALECTLRARVEAAVLRSSGGAHA